MIIYDKEGILVHKYGPHIFHTNSREVYDYLGQFTQWRPYEHRVLASVDGILVPIPINLTTINKLYGIHLSNAEVDSIFKKQSRKYTSCPNFRRCCIKQSWKRII